MNFTITKTNYFAVINLGLQKNYSGEYWKKTDYIRFIQKWQQKNTNPKTFQFCPAVYEFDLVCGNLIEKHIALKFTSFPGQKLRKKEFRKKIIEFAQLLSSGFDQNRVLIEFKDRNILLEVTKNTDQKIS